MTSAEELALGVIVCCRDEERVIARRLANLAVSQWPAAERMQRVVVVDDGSRDATLELAQEFAGPWPPGVTCEVIRNRRGPGKAGAIASAVEHLGSSVDIVVLTDADVTHAPDALRELAAAFSREPRLGMAFGSQRFVDALPADGSMVSLRGGSGGSFYDRASAWMRALESRSGRAFSVHGQLLAWRSSLRLSPRPGYAADDLDLMLQARVANARVARVAAARFFEVKPKGVLRRAQAVRRARAYIQFARQLDPRAAPDVVTCWQWRAYRSASLLVPLIFTAVLVLEVSVLILATWAANRFAPGSTKGIVWVLPWVLMFAPVLQTWWLWSVIVEARRLEASKSMDDRWSTAR